MFVGWNMKTNLITITPDTSVFKARELMDAHKVSHLPVTDGKAHLVGIVTDRDVKGAWASPATTLSVHELTYVLQKLSVENIMKRDVVTASPDMTIERAAHIIQQRKIGALPVVQDRRLVGIITTTDLTEVLLSALGLGDDTRRYSLVVRDRIGVLADVTRLMAQQSINIRSIIFAPLKLYKDMWQIIIRVSVADFDKAVATVHEAGYKAVTEYVEDLTPFLPKG